MRDVRPVVVLTVAVVSVFAVVAAVLFVVGAAQPPRKGAILTDRLGPESGESVSDYQARARSSLDLRSSEPHYALVSLRESITSADAAAFVERVRVSEVLYRESPDSALITAGTSADPESVARSGGVVPDGCVCAIALVARGSSDRLTELLDRPNVLAVEALPADAVFGRFAVVPLSPPGP